MRFQYFERHSLKTRVTLFTLVIFVLSLWSLSLFASRELRADMQQMLSQQQTSAVSLLADEIHHELTDRLVALEKAALGTQPMARPCWDAPQESRFSKCQRLCVTNRGKSLQHWLALQI